MTKDELMQNCLAECLRCYQTCLKTISYCLEKGGKHAAPEHIKQLMDCAEICQTSANFMLRGSTHHASVCTACALICRVCGVSCEEFKDSDETMSGCADACFSCADACEAMTASA